MTPERWLMVPLIVGGLASIFYDAATDVMAKFFSIKGTQ